MDNETDQMIMLAHGGGGEMTKKLLAEHVLPKLSNDFLNPLLDSAVLPKMEGRPVFTTDSYVVQPLEFRGGDIGRLAVCGTVNDLAVMGARPIALSLALVIEEGLSFKVFDRILDSIKNAAYEAEVPIATGDTKVGERRNGDGLMITTAGVGELRDDIDLNPGRIKSGDKIIITGHIGDHGLAVMAAREGLGLTSKLKSDAAPLACLVERILEEGGEDVKFMRDPTRGGLAGVLSDLVEDTGLGLLIDEQALPVTNAARHAAELLGLDLLTIANEGKVVVVVSEGSANRILAACRSHPLGSQAACIGRITKTDLPFAELKTSIGGHRIIQRPYGEELPRIC